MAPPPLSASPPAGTNDGSKSLSPASAPSSLRPSAPCSTAPPTPGSTLLPYQTALRRALLTALCIEAFPCQAVERGHSRPEVEYRDNPELLLPPVTVARSEREHCLIEPSVNSVRVSLRLHHADSLEEVLAAMYTRFLMQRADRLDVLRRRPLEGYDVSFLFTDEHVRALGRERLAGFVCAFVEHVDVQVNGLKLDVNQRGRAMATEFLRALAF